MMIFLALLSSVYLSSGTLPDQEVQEILNQPNDSRFEMAQCLKEAKDNSNATLNVSLDALYGSAEDTAQTITEEGSLTAVDEGEFSEFLSEICQALTTNTDQDTSDFDEAFQEHLRNNLKTIAQHLKETDPANAFALCSFEDFDDTATQHMLAHYGIDEIDQESLLISQLLWACEDNPALCQGDFDASDAALVQLRDRDTYTMPVEGSRPVQSNNETLMAWLLKPLQWKLFGHHTEVKFPPKTEITFSDKLASMRPEEHTYVYLQEVSGQARWNDELEMPLENESTFIAVIPSENSPRSEVLWVAVKATDIAKALGQSVEKTLYAPWAEQIYVIDDKGSIPSVDTKVSYEAMNLTSWTRVTKHDQNKNGFWKTFDADSSDIEDTWEAALIESIAAMYHARELRQQAAKSTTSRSNLNRRYQALKAIYWHLYLNHTDHPKKWSNAVETLSQLHEDLVLIDTEISRD